MTEENIDTVKDTTNQQEVCLTEKRIRKRQSSTEADGKGFKRTKTTQQPRWHNQSYMLFLALRQHTERSLPRGELIKRALALDRKISAELSLPKVFKGKTPANSASAILTNNNDRYFIPFKPEGSRSTHFKLAYEPGDTETAVQEYQKWCKKLVEHDWPYCFGIPKVDLHEHYHTPISDIDSLKAESNAEETIPATIDEIMTESTINTSQEVTNNTSTDNADETVADSTIATNNNITNESNLQDTTTAENNIPVGENSTKNTTTDDTITTGENIANIPDSTIDNTAVENITNGAITTDNNNTTGESTRNNSMTTEDISLVQSNETINTADNIDTVISNTEDSTTTISEHVKVETTSVELSSTTKPSGSPKSNKKPVIEPAPMYTLDQLDLTDIPKHWTDIVEVRPSLIPGAGNGLFAKRKLPYNTPIGFYFGVPMTEDEFDSLKDRVGRSSEYSIMYRRTVLDATDEKGEPVTDQESGRFCAFHFMNETNETGANVAFVEGVVVNQVICWTRKDIEAGEELLVWYGADVNRYWNDKENDNRPKLKREYSMTESIVQATEKVSIDEQ